MTEELDMSGWLGEKAREARGRGKLQNREVVFRVLYLELVGWEIEEEKTIFLDSAGVARLVVRPNREGNEVTVTRDGFADMKIDGDGLVEIAGDLTESAAISLLERVALELRGAGCER